MFCFNRTIVELKHAENPEFQQVFDSFNRTIVELKLRGAVIPTVIFSRFNRTIVELKRRIATKGNFIGLVLIGLL